MMGELKLDETLAFSHESLVSSDTGMVCDWSGITTEMELPKCVRETCPSHRAEDTIPFSDVVAPPLGEDLTNTYFYNLTSPFNQQMPYVHDSVKSSPACTLGSIEVERAEWAGASLQDFIRFCCRSAIVGDGAFVTMSSSKPHALSNSKRKVHHRFDIELSILSAGVQGNAL